MFESSESAADRPWFLRPWPLAMVVALLVLVLGGVYLTATGRSPSGSGAAAGSSSPATAAAAAGAAMTDPARAARPGGTEPGAVYTPETLTPPGPAALGDGVAATTPAPAPAPDATALGAAASGRPSVCGLPAGGQQIPVSPPAASWRLLGSVAVPVSATFGPGKVDGNGIGDCFSHSPTGALFAAMGTVAALNLPIDLVDPALVIEQRVAPIGDAYPAMVAQARQAAAAARGRMPSEGGAQQKVALAGFAYTDYSGDRAVINLAVTVGDAARPDAYLQALMPVVMVWTGGDWKLVYTVATARPQPVISADQFIGWAP